MHARLSRPVWLGPSWLVRSRPCVPVQPASCLPASNLAVLDLDSPYLRAVAKKNKRRQGWSLSKLLLHPRPRPAPSPATAVPPILSSAADHLCKTNPAVLCSATNEFLSALNLASEENSAESHCWWAAAAGSDPRAMLDLMLRVVDQAQASFGMSLQKAWSLLTPATNTVQIALSVSALQDVFPTGLLIAHDPGRGVYLFRSGLEPRFVSHSFGAKWKCMFPSTPVMLFTQAPSAECGHFQRCLPTHDVACPSCCTLTTPEVSMPPASACTPPDAVSMNGGAFAQRFHGYAHVIDLCTDSDAHSSPQRYIDLQSESNASSPSSSQQQTRCHDRDVHVPMLPHPFCSNLLEPAQVQSNSDSATRITACAVASNVEVSPTVPFSMHCSAPATWLDRLSPASSHGASLSFASITSQEEAPVVPNPCPVCQAFHLSECYCLQSTVCNAEPPAPRTSSIRRFVCGCSCVGMFGVCLCGYVRRAEAALREPPSPSVLATPSSPTEPSSPTAETSANATQQSPAMDAASFGFASGSAGPFDLDADSGVNVVMQVECSQCAPFSPECSPSRPASLSEARLPPMTGGMFAPGLPSTPVHPESTGATYWNLLTIGVSAPLAREAAQRFLDDFDAALDWACASDRRHTLPLPTFIDLVDSPEAENFSSHVHASPHGSAARPVPTSWLSNAPSCHLLDSSSQAIVGSAVPSSMPIPDLPSIPAAAPAAPARSSSQPSATTLAEAAPSVHAHENMQEMPTANEPAGGRSAVMSSPSPPLMLPVPDRVAEFWHARRNALERTVATLYSQHRRLDARDTLALAALFHALPSEWPVQPHHFSLSLDLLFDQELELWRQRAVDSVAFQGTIRDAWNSQLNVVKLLPFFLAVLSVFAEKAGIAREFPLGFALTMAPWLCHRSLHVCFNPLKPEHEVRPRLFVTLVAESNCGKSPFFRQLVDAVFVSHSASRPCLVDTFPDRFVDPGPGKDKTLFVQQCTNSDFARRMKASQGHLCWVSEEAWSALDVAWAKGKGRVTHTDRKVQHCFLQNTQNGNSYGPLSINAEQFFVSTTNFAFFHAGQPKVVHDYWGQAFMKDCPFGGMGWEFRPTFLWPRDQPEYDPDMPHVTFSGAARFLLDIFARLCTCYGQTLDSIGFDSFPIPVADPAAAMWSKFRHQAEKDKDTVPICAAGAVGKHCFTTTSHIAACHLLQQAFLDIKNGRVDLDSLRKPTPQSSAVAPSLPWPQSIQPVSPDLVLAAPEHLHLMLTGVLTCFNEMKLPQSERAGPPVLDENRLRPDRQQKRPHELMEAPPQNADEEALAILLQRCQEQSHISVTNVNTILPRRLKFRSDQEAICRLFDLATQYHAGVREGSPNAALRLRLTLPNIDPPFRQRLNLQLSVPCTAAGEEPPMAGPGNRARRAQDAEPELPVPVEEASPCMTGAGKRGNRPAAEAPQAEDAGDAEEEEEVNKKERQKKLEKVTLLEPIYIPANPVTAAQVQTSVNEILRGQHEQVHGQPFQIKATSVKRKKKQSFQLRCGVCQHGTCSWRGVASFNQKSLLLSASYMKKGSHGQRKAPKAASGRKEGSVEARKFPVQETLAYSGNLDHPSIAATIEKHFADLPLQNSLLVRCKPRKQTRRGPTCIFICKTHYHRNTNAKCEWGGAACVTTQADGQRQLCLRYRRSQDHAPDELQLYNTLTWRQRQAAKRSGKLDTSALTEVIHSIKDPVDAARPCPPIKRNAIAGFAQRFRKKLRPARGEAPTAGNGVGHVASDFEYCQDRCNASLHRGQVALLPTSPSLVASDSNLRVVDMQLAPSNVCVPLICPELLHLTLSLLPKPWNLKVSTDGTYRLLFDSYTLLTLGVNVKNWSRRKDLSVFSFRSSFVPLGFALANKENDEAYTHLGVTLVQTAQTLGHNLGPEHILQWHGDMHLGIEAARKKLAPKSIRLADWAHVTGATSQGPSGFAGFLTKELPSEAKDSLLPWLLQFCRISKQLPGFLFHVVWRAIFSDLHQHCRNSTVQKLQNQYFCQVAVGNEGETIWDAPWRSAPDRIMPGTDAGSAPQESWHGSVLKPAFGAGPRKPAEVAQILHEQIVRPQLRTLNSMKLEGTTFQDWPDIGQFLDQHVLHGDTQLKKEGRTPAKSLLRWGLHQRFEDEAGNIWMLVPTSKFKADWSKTQGKKRQYKARSPILLPANAVQQFSAIVTATSVEEVEGALSQLGLYDLRNQTFTSWRDAAKAFDDWRCVVSGPFSQALWKEYRTDDQVDDAGAQSHNKHNLWLCFGCHAASLWGPCEHAYCCMEHEGQSSTQVLPKPKPKGRPKKKAAQHHHPSPIQIVPSSAEPVQQSPALPPVQEQPLPSPESIALTTLLRRAGLGHLVQPMLQQGVSLPALRRFTFSDFWNVFRMSVGESHAVMAALEQQDAAATVAASCWT